jgi:hypothetical protein
VALHVTIEEVQQWLEPTKLTVPSVDVELEATAALLVLNTLSTEYTTTTWVDDTTTPPIVRKIISMLVAAWLYNRAYSEETPDGNNYALWLESKAYALLQGLVSGTIDIPEVPGEAAAIGPATYYPTDVTGAVEQYNALGYQVGVLGQDDIKFRMGDVF